MRGARLMHDREVRADRIGELERVLRTAGVGRNRDHTSARQSEITEVLREQRHRRHMVDRDREEALDLTRMEVHRQHAIGAGELQHVRDEPAGDRFARPGLAVLARIRKPRDNRGDALRRRELRRLDHEQQFHQVAVDGLAAGLDDEDVGASR